MQISSSLRTVEDRERWKVITGSMFLNALPRFHCLLTEWKKNSYQLLKRFVLGPYRCYVFMHYLIEYFRLFAAVTMYTFVQVDIHVMWVRANVTKVIYRQNCL